METVKVNTSQHVDIDYPVAGVGERMASWLIDIAALGLTFLIFLFVFSATDLLKSAIFGKVMLVIYAFLFLFYDLLCEVFMNGQTLGKHILKTKVVSLDGGQPNLGQYFIRWVFRIVDFPLTAWAGGFLCVVLSDNKQRIGDIVAGTTVIKTVPRTKLHHIAFHPATEAYTPVFDSVHLLTDRDVELVHEVLNTYYKTFNPKLVYQMAGKISSHLGTAIPEGMNELDFLRTIVMDYNQVTSRAI
ncbi:RDD family protein [Pedobacter sp. KR3-3]|uniref:RDD family protein n=1 Tax=Pedobacter albus TaxID=3113905 RepID=A0ABU7IA13_9SPHI|nr:RDD family protein [Pedobacter sp. KR3-3]MEE1946121.1 RDD family protein [Pedobacter sp. KR3-3]